MDAEDAACSRCGAPVAAGNMMLHGFRCPGRPADQRSERAGAEAAASADGVSGSGAAAERGGEDVAVANGASTVALAPTPAAPSPAAEIQLTDAEYELLAKVKASIRAPAPARSPPAGAQAGQEQADTALVRALQQALDLDCNKGLQAHEEDEKEQPADAVPPPPPPPAPLTPPPALPPGWEQQRTCDGLVYYLNHNDRSTHWTLPPDAASASLPPPPPDAVLDPRVSDKQDERATAVSKHMTCCICVHVMHKPVTLVPCQHNFCASCYSDAREHSDVCPQCRTPVDNITRNHTLISIIEGFLDAHPACKRPADDLKDLDARDKLSAELLRPQEEEEEAARKATEEEAARLAAEEAARKAAEEEAARLAAEEWMADYVYSPSSFERKRQEEQRHLPARYTLQLVSHAHAT
eukprot:Tamp_07146.p1 GENE.Tamp_07146~~Tamp_07146.p1  ORF type:complete len:450 (-),score=99.21 Tamp_07146:1210-2439(-)